MRNLILGVSVGLAALVSAAPAQAGVVYFHAHGTPQTLPSNAVVIANFDGLNPGAFTADPNRIGVRGGIASGNSNPPNPRTPTSAPSSLRKPLDGTGNFAYVIGAATYTINFSAAQVFSFVFGSLDPTNEVTLNFAGGGSRSFVGAQLTGSASSTIVNGVTPTDGRFYYDAQGIGGALGSVVSAVFTSGPNSALEFDTIATAAPEPATWAMMILGFGLVGGALRRKRSVRTMAIA